MLSKIPVIAIVGPTASGKTALSVELAKRLDGEILSFDSMQLYRGMDIATAKPTPLEMGSVPHHMIDCFDRDEPFSVAKYKELADKIIADIYSRGKRVIMVGGTGLYLDTVLQNIEFLESEDTSKIREELKAELEKEGIDKIYNRLVEIDPKAAASIHKNNTGRVLRALEVYIATGKTMTEQVEESRKNPSPYNPIYIGLTYSDRELLYERINKRVDIMMESGLLSEAEEFYNFISTQSNSENKSKKSTSGQAIGLKELIPYFDGELDLESCVENIKRETRRYAKRQLTWFRRNKEVNWFEADKYENSDDLLEAVLTLVDQEVDKEIEKEIDKDIEKGELT